MKELVQFICADEQTALTIEDKSGIEESFILLKGGLVGRPFLLSIEIVRCALGDDTLKQLADILKETSVERLILSENKISHEGIAPFSEALKINKTLQLLVLDHNQIKSEGLIAISSALVQSPNLTQLSAVHNAIGDDGVLFLINSLKESFRKQGKHHVFPLFNLSYNLIGDKGCASIAEYCALNPTVYQVELEGNLIGDAGVNAFAKSITGAHFKVEILNLALNQISSKSLTQQLAEAFAQLKSTLYLDLSDNVLMSRKAISTFLGFETPMSVLQFKVGRIVENATNEGASALLDPMLKKTKKLLNFFGKRAL